MSQVPQQNSEVPQGPLQNPLVPQGPQQNPQVPQGPLQNPHFQHQDPEVPPQHPQVPPQDQQISVPKGKGRRRVDTSQKIENEANREVTFSKRRNGLFKKASELVTLCGVQLMMIIFSPRGKPYSFGHPSVDNIIDRWQTGITGPTDPTDNIMAAERDENSRRLNMQLTEAQAMLEAETHRELELQHAMAVRRTQHRWEAPLEELSTEEILQFQAALKALQVNVEMEKKRRMQQQQQQNPLAFQPGPSASSSLGVSGNVFPPFPGSPNPFGEGVSGFPQFLDGSSSSTGPNPFGDLPFSTGASSSGPSVADDLPPLPICYSSVAVSSGGPGGLPPFPGQASSFGRGGALTFPPGPRSFPGEASSSGHGSAVPFPPGPSSFGPGEGSGSGSGSGSGGGQRRGLHVRGGFPVRGRGRPSGSGRGFS